MQTYSATGSAKAIGAEEDDLDSARLGQWVREQGRAETKNTQLRSAARLLCSGVFYSVSAQKSCKTVQFLRNLLHQNSLNCKIGLHCFLLQCESRE